MDSGKKDVTIQLAEQDCAGIVFAETSVLQGDDTELADARRVIAGIAYKRDGDGCANPIIPSPNDLLNPITKRIWEKCQAAAKAARSDDVKTCQHFVIWYSDDNGKSPSMKPKRMQADWPYDQKDKIKKNWGPFKMPFAPTMFPFGLGTITLMDLTAGAVTNIYVMQYCGVP